MEAKKNNNKVLFTVRLPGLVLDQYREDTNGNTTDENIVIEVKSHQTPERQNVDTGH